MRSCQEVVEALGVLLDDEVAAELRGDLSMHLSECRSCRALYDTTRHTLRIVTESGSFELPADLSERIRRKILDKLPPPRTG